MRAASQALIVMSTSQQSTTQRRASPSSQYPDSPYTQQTTATDVCSACGSRPLPAPLAQGTSCVDVDQDQSNVIVNQPLTVSDPMGIGEHLGHASRIAINPVRRS